MIKEDNTGRIRNCLLGCRPITNSRFARGSQANRQKKLSPQLKFVNGCSFIF